MNDAPASRRAGAIADALRARGMREARVALVLGTGLGGLADAIEAPVIVPYGEIPGMPASTAPGHAGRFVGGRLAGVPVLALQGRFHPYEGWTGRDIAAPVYALKALGIETLVVTNAAGALNETYRPGELVMIADHLNLTGGSPLVGPNDDAIGVRFPDLSRLYWPAHRACAARAAAALGLPLPEGVYAGVLGPALETPAERRMLRLLGADLVGMSTIHEVLAAAHGGLKVLAFSAVANMATGGPGQAPDTLEDVLAHAGHAAASLERLLRALLPELDAGAGPAS